MKRAFLPKDPALVALCESESVKYKNMQQNYKKKLPKII